MNRLGFSVVVAVLFSVIVVLRCFADVVELKTGERVEGILRQATPAGVVFEVGGQTIQFDPQKVRAIYFGLAPPAAAPAISPAEGALQALKTLRSVTRGGVSRRDYGPRLSDTKIQVDKYLEQSGGTDRELRTVVGGAMQVYMIAGDVWSTFHRSMNIMRKDQVEPLKMCSPFRAYVDEVGRSGGFYGWSADGSKNEAIVDEGAVSAIWACASEKIDEADRLLRSGVTSRPR